MPTSETGTRHRTAERVARSIDVPVISVSEDMAIVAVYVGDQKHTLEPIPRLLNRANQALQTLERYKNRLDEVTARAVRRSRSRTSSPCATSSRVLQRTEMVRRIAEEIEGDIVELGADGRLVRLQLEELMGGVEDDRRLVVQDYFHEDADWHVDEALDGARRPRAPRTCSTSRRSAPALHLPDEQLDLDERLQPRGYRLLAKIPRLPEPIIEHIVDRFGNLQKIMRATIDDLDDVEGVGEARARAIKEGLSPARRDQHPRPLQLTARRPSRLDRADVDAHRRCPPARPSSSPARRRRAPIRGLVLIPDIMGLRPLFDDHAPAAGRRATAGRSCASSRGRAGRTCRSRSACGAVGTIDDRRAARPTCVAAADLLERASRSASSASAWAACTR